MGSRVSVLNNADGRLEIFVRGTDGALWHKWQTAPNNGWSGWASLGGVITEAPVAGRNKDGRLEVFGRGTDGALWHIWQTAPNNGWSGWASLGGGIDDAVGDQQCRRSAGGLRARHGQRALAHLADRAEQRLERLVIIRRRADRRSGRRAQRRRPARGLRQGHGQRVVAHLAERAEQRLELS